jgi:hypothetical protein
MHAAYVVGLFWILIAGVAQGVFVLPMKYTRAWKWEHLWFWFSILAFFVLPLVVAILVVPHLHTALAKINPGIGWFRDQLS